MLIFPGVHIAEGKMIQHRPFEFLVGQNGRHSDQSFSAVSRRATLTNRFLDSLIEALRRVRPCVTQMVSLQRASECMPPHARSRAANVIELRLLTKLINHCGPTFPECLRTFLDDLSFSYCRRAKKRNLVTA